LGKIAVVNNLVFPTGAILKDERSFIHYGAAYKLIGTLTLDLKELIAEIKNQQQ
jgi:predicted GH43/DUF377 family glycosyl hydrolase